MLLLEEFVSGKWTLRERRRSPLSTRQLNAAIAYHSGCMKTSNAQDQRIAKMSFASVYPMYLAKVKKKGRTRDELHQVIKWLTGFDDPRLQELIEEKATFETFFGKAKLNPNAHLITGVICGYRVEEIENPLTRQVRYLDKLVDELAKGRNMEKILRS
jgi:hypothetical protein